MALEPGTRLGPYEITGLIGAGGMGEVYAARDTRLDRTVAVKVSAEQFTERFEREARAVAALNHPHICTLHDVGPNYLVMEYVDGRTLAERIAEGPMLLAEALPIARQIAEALEAAHEKGIVHRDLKPANIKLTPDGRVKVLDFGLAKAAETAAPSDSVNSPTITLAATRAGVILGTAAYMSPEQARGAAVDKRADIWAYGVVLYEMLTCRTVFSGETVSDTLAAVLRADLDWRALPPETPASIRRLLRRCLERDRKRRLPDIAMARIEIDDAQEPAATAVIPVKRANHWLLAAGAVATAAALVLAVVHFREAAPPEPPTVQFQVPLPPNIAFGGHVSISPDGKLLAFAGVGRDNIPMLWIRPLNALEAHPLPGTEGSGYYFWSPDSRLIGFWAGGKLRKIEVAGGPPQTICEAPLALGGAWNRDGVILFGSNMRGLYRVSANGGTASPLTQPDAAVHEVYHAWPMFLPDGRHFLYMASSSDGGILFAASLDSKERKSLGGMRSGAAYAPSSDPNTGRLLFLRETVLLEQPFNARSLAFEGDPSMVAEPVGAFLTRGFFSASKSGVLVYRSGVGVSTKLEWFDREGRRLGSVGQGPYYNDLSLSPDGTRVAVSRGDTGPGTDIWIVEPARGTNTRFTFRGSGQTNGVWSPDGTRLAYACGSPPAICVAPLSGGNEEVLLGSEGGAVRPFDWSRDGKYLLYAASGSTTGVDLYTLELAPRGKRQPYLQSQFSESEGQFSPDGRWIAYVSDESGRQEVFVQSFPVPGSKSQISTAGGAQPRWRDDGKELFYLAPDRRLMAVDVKTSPPFTASVPKPLFASSIAMLQVTPTGTYRYSPTPDGKRFLINISEDQATDDTPFTVVLNWRARR
jgi:Tol biopolymer transport system component/predicted Ser/Thr protein kinase